MQQQFIGLMVCFLLPLLGSTQTGEYHEGLAWIWKDGRYGYVNQNGKVVIEPKYDFACRFSDGLAKVVIPIEYDACYYPSEAPSERSFWKGRIRVRKTENKFLQKDETKTYCIDKQGNKVGCRQDFE